MNIIPSQLKRNLKRFIWITGLVIAACNGALAQAPAPDPLMITGATASTVALAWNDIYDNEDGFRLNRWDGMNYRTVAVLGPNVTNYLDTGLSVGVTYNYDVVALNAEGDSFPAANSAQTTPISAPGPLVITGVTANTIGLAWNDSYANEDGFRLNRWDGMSYGPVAVLGPNVTNYLDTGLSVGVTYYYNVVAFNSGGDSFPAANFAQTTPIPAPDPLVITTVTANTIGLAWNDSYANEAGFRLNRWDGMNYRTVAVLGPNVTNYFDTGLSVGVTYYYNVVAFNSGGDSFPAANFAQTTPIPAPDPLVITTVTANTIGLAWNDSYANEDGFRLNRWDGMNYGTVAVLGPNVTNYLDTGLSVGVTYHYNVVAFDSGGDSFPAANFAQTTPIPAPDPLVITGITGTTIGLAWNDIYGNEDGFRLNRWDGMNYVTVAVLGPNATNYLDTGLSIGATYYYSVVAFNSGGDSFPAANFAQTTPISAPEPLVITGVTANTIGLAWNDIYANEDGFRLNRWDGMNYATVAVLGPNVTNYLDIGLSIGVTYYYSVVAFNSGGDSFPAANFAQTTPIPAPDPLVITTVTANTIGLAWNDIYANEDGFRLERSTDSASFSPIANLAANATNYLDTGLTPGNYYYYRVVAFNSGGDSFYSATVSGGAMPVPAPDPLVVTGIGSTEIGLNWNDIYSDEDGFRLERSTDSVNFSPIANLPANATSYANTNLLPETFYSYRVAGFNSGGDSFYSMTVNATTLPLPPFTPSDLLASAASQTAIALTWTDAAINETGFKIERSLDCINFTPINSVGSNIADYSDTGLTAGTAYYYRVAATNAGGSSAYSPVASATTLPNAPTAPSGLTATAVSQTQIVLNWTDTASNETGFKIERSQDGINFTQISSVGPNTPDYSDTGLTANTTYYYRIAADNAGGSSAYSAVASATTLPNPPGTPSGLAATAVSQTQIVLNWTDTANNETGFNIERSQDGINFAQISSMGPNATGYSDTGLTANTAYYYRIAATNAGGSSAYSAVASATTLPNPPATPSGLAATAVSQTQIALSWDDTADNETGFKIERSQDGINFTQISSVSPNTAGYSDTELTANTTYYYRIAANNAGGSSAYSALANATTLPNAPAAPLGLAATAVSQTQITLLWTDTANNEMGFKIERSQDGSNFTQISSVGPNTADHFDTGLSADATYYYRVAATNAGGSSAHSAVASATTLPNPPGTPSGLAATAVSQTQIVLNWTDTANDEMGFKIERSQDGINFAQISSMGPNATGYSDTGLTANTAYYYRIAATNAGGSSAYSTMASATTLPNAPAAPSDFAATAISQTQIALNWTDTANNETGFKIERSLDGINFTQLSSAGPDTADYSDTGLPAGTAYHYRVAATNAGGSSAYSALANATTLPNAPAAPLGLAATAVSQTQITLNWTDNANNETGFKIERSLDGVNFALVATVGADATTYSDLGLNPITSYYYRISAFNAGGNSAASNLASATTPDYVPAAPSALSASAVSAGQINLAWTDNAQNETGFKIYRSADGVNFTQIAAVSANVTSYANAGLSPATTYYYRLAAYNATGDSGLSNVASAATPDVPPIAPSALAATAVSSNRINLTWTDNANNETGYFIERSTNGVTFTQIAAVGANVTTYTNTGLVASTTYYYRVRATNPAGNSGYSNTASATTGAAAPPAKPSNLALGVVSASQINLTWKDNSSNETQFLIERSLNGNSFTQIASVGANVVSYSATGLQADTRYYFRVRASNSAGDSAYSNAPNTKTQK